MPISGVASIVPKTYIGRSVLKFFVHRTPTKRIICLDGQVRKAPACNFKHLNPDVLLNNFELEVESELLPVLADAGKHGRIKYVIQNETLVASRNIHNIHSGRGQFCDIPCRFISAPLCYSRVFSRLCSDGDKLESRPLPFIENERFLELQKMLSTYQETGKPVSNQILNALQLWCAEQNGCAYFLTVDLNLIKVIRNQNNRPLTQVVKPSELIKIIFNNPIPRPRGGRIQMDQVHPCDVANAADKQFSVFVSVPIKNDLTYYVKSTVTRELQKLPDIKLVDELLHGKGQYVVSIVAVPFKLPSRVNVGIVLSYVFQNSDQIVHGVLTGIVEDLENLCKQLVSICNFNFLESNRRK